MNAHTLSPDAARLKAVRASLGAIAPAAWSRAQDESGPLIEARADFGEIVVLARFSEHASADEVAFAADAPETVAFLLRLLDEAFARIRAMKGEPARGERRGKDYAAECAMKCAEPGFQRFLAERHGLEPPLSTDRAAQKVRGILGVTSRAELNDSQAAADGWKALRAAFETWRRAG